MKVFFLVLIDIRINDMEILERVFFNVELFVVIYKVYFCIR